MGYVYIIKNNSNLYKIGCTCNLNERTKRLNYMNGGISIILIFKFDDYKYYENKFHKLFKDKRQLGEWFNLSDNDLDFIKNRYENNIICKGVY